MTEKIYLIKKAMPQPVRFRVEHVVWDPAMQSARLECTGIPFPFREFMQAYDALLRSDKGYNPDFEIPETQDGLARQCRYLLMSDCMYFIFRPDGTIASFIKITPRQRESRVDISDLYTVPDCRGTGMGSSLIRFAENLACSMQLDSLCLDTYVNNLPAIRFYAGLDFKPAACGNFSMRPPDSLSPEQLEYIRQSLSQQYQREFSMDEVLDYIKRLSLIGLAASAYAGYREGKGETVNKLIGMFPYVNACLKYFQERGAGHGSFLGTLAEMGLNYFLKNQVKKRTENANHE